MTIDYIMFITFLLIFNIFVIFNFKRISKTINLYDIPDTVRKIHDNPVPLIGGFIIFINTLFFITFFFIYESNFLLKYFYFTELKPFIYFLLFLVLIFLIGLYDDKYNLGALSRLVMISFLIYFYLKVDNTSIIHQLNFSFTGHQINFEIGSIIFTSICLIILLISCNMFDGINLQSFLFYIINFSFLYYMHSNFYLLVLIFSIFIFGILNFNGKIFLGDSGVYILSLILGIFYIKYYNFMPGRIEADIIFSILLLPVLDAGRCIVHRIINGKNPFAGDRNHFHYLLLKKYSYTKTILLISALILVPIINYFLNVNTFYGISLVLFIYFYLYFFKLSKFL